MRAAPLLWLTMLGCGRTSADLGDWTVELDKRTGVLDVSHEIYGEVLTGVELYVGQGSATVEMSLGSFRFEDETATLATVGGVRSSHTRTTPVLFDLEDEDGEPLATLVAYDSGGALTLELTANDPSMNRLGWSAACDPDDHFMGFGSHAMDVDHVGQAFPLWVSEPGVGKSETEVLPGDWYQTGTRHASSFPVPFLLRPHRSQGAWLATTARVEVDLCASDPERFEVLTWQPGTLATVLIAENTPVDAVARQSLLTGRPPLPPAWTFAPWNDAVRGEARVREVAERLRAFGAPSSVIWTEDWKGGEDSLYGYHLLPSWELDETLYPDAGTLADDLEALGFKWFAYFAPFLSEDTEAFDELVAIDGTIQTADGEPYTFLGVPSFDPTTLVDLTDGAANQWVLDKLNAALDLGFDGWMADYAEWLPPDATLDSGDDALTVHNAYPLWWQEVNLAAMEDRDATFFVRSGWAGTSERAPVVWAGDQRTSFDTDDGFPTVIPLGLGLAASGVPNAFAHDVGGYQSLGNDPSDKELWFRWAALGAYTPVMRTHHGAFADDNWQFDSDDETTEHWAAMGREHARLFPYLFGLAARASDDGVPMLLPPAFLYETEWGRMDAWLLGDALFVAPVLERGVDGRDVELPGGVDWYSWPDLAPAQSGWFDADLTEIPVFAAANTTVPTLAEAPDTLTAATADGVTDLDDVDGARVVYVFGDGGRFLEADGTLYLPRGAATGSGEGTATFESGELEVAGVTVEISGPRERTYTVVVTR